MPRRNWIASGPRSPVRMRIASSIVVTKILPSPIRPVWAALLNRLHGALDERIHYHLDLHLRQKSTTYSAPR